MFDSVVIIIDFEKIDYVNFIRTKSELEVKLFVFKYIYVKVNWIACKNQFENQKLQILSSRSIAETKSILPTPLETILSLHEVAQTDKNLFCRGCIQA